MTGDSGTSSVKLQKAKNLGISIVSESFFDELRPDAISMLSKHQKCQRDMHCHPTCQLTQQKTNVPGKIENSTSVGKVVDICNVDLNDPDVDTAASISASLAPCLPPKPLIQLQEGDTETVPGSRGNFYEIRLRGGNYYCTCPAWKNQRAGLVRTCKHLRKFLGNEFEDWRLKSSKPSAFHLSKPILNNGKCNITNHIPVATKPDLMLARKWNEDVHDPQGWWMSEKYDGVRAYWNGTCFISRGGNKFFAPQYFTKDLPTVRASIVVIQHPCTVF